MGPQLHKRVAFISTMVGAPWGGSEELWSRTALYLSKEGFGVSTSLDEWLPLHERVLELARGGIDIWLRPKDYSLLKKAWNRARFGATRDTVLEAQRFLAKQRPALAVFSDGGPFPPIELLEYSIAKKIPFVALGQVNSYDFWIDDILAERYRKALTAARRCYFVSNANLQLAELQIGCKLTNAEVVWNPFNVDFHASPPWPSVNETQELRLSSVARLDPRAKGQDLLLEALARPIWANRNWRLTLHGEGRMRNVLERLIERFGVSNRVVFGGHVTVEGIWAANHVLVMPSRFEGLPLAMVEAMLCGRPVLATDVAGHSEIIEDGVTGFMAEAPTVPAVAHSLERLWEQRANLQQMGRAGAERIRQLVPMDPVSIFADKIKSLIQ